MNIDGVVAHVRSVAADLAAGRSVEDLAREAAPVVASLDDDLVFVWMTVWVREREARCHLEDVPLDGPWEGSLGTAFSSGDSDFAGVSLAFRGRPGPAEVNGPSKAREEGVLDAVREAVESRGLTNLQVLVLEWDVLQGNASPEDFLQTLQVAAGNAVFDAMQSVAARQAAFLNAQFESFNGLLNGYDGARSKIAVWARKTDTEKDAVLTRFGLL